jgi:hypothetical protein
MFVPPPALSAEEFTSTANAVDRRTNPPQSKRLRTTARSDFWDKPLRFVVQWEQFASFSSELNALSRREREFVPVSVQLPITKPIAPGSMRIAVKRAILGRVAIADASGGSTIRNELAGGSIGTNSSIKVFTRGLTEGPFATNGHVQPVEILEIGPPMEFAIIRDDGSGIYPLDALSQQVIDPSNVHHPTFLPNSGHFTFDIFAEGGFQPNLSGSGSTPPITRNFPGPGEDGRYRCLAEFVIFPDPYWSRT